MQCIAPPCFSFGLLMHSNVAMNALQRGYQCTPTWLDTDWPMPHTLPSRAHHTTTALRTHVRARALRAHHTTTALRTHLLARALRAPPFARPRSHLPPMHTHIHIHIHTRTRTYACTHIPPPTPPPAPSPEHASIVITTPVLTMTPLITCCPHHRRAALLPGVPMLRDTPLWTAVRRWRWTACPRHR